MNRMNIFMIGCIITLILLVILFALACCKAAGEDDYVNLDNAFEITELRDIDGK